MELPGILELKAMWGTVLLHLVNHSLEELVELQELEIQVKMGLAV